MPMDEESAKKNNILIVDDTPDNIRIAAEILKRQGYRIAFDLDGESALTHTKLVKFDLILLDIMMHGMDGYEVCRRLKADPETKDIPVIFLTVRSDTDSIVRGFQVGGADYVTKPFDEIELLARANTHLELGRYRRHLERLIRERTSAIDVILRVREESAAEIGKKITDNILCRISPTIETLENTLTDSEQKVYLNIMKSRLGEILSEFSKKLSCPGINLTPTEMRIAGLIRDGRNGRQIAELLHISENTITFHRNNIRKKLGLTKRKESLKSFLKSMD